ncbi:hypothetical protein FHG87_021349 [Trinorchestia longiramus]|nr:hypothetical protein FHG87_021349 [Trinorchestia longiramus]
MEENIDSELRVFECLSGTCTPLRTERQVGEIMDVSCGLVSVWSGCISEIATCPYKKQVIHQKIENQKNHKTEKNNRTYLDIVKTAIQQTNQPTPALTLSINTHIKLAALVIESHIANLAKIESYRSILSKSLKRNFNIDTSFPDRDSQKIFHLFINMLRVAVDTLQGPITIGTTYIPPHINYINYIDMHTLLRRKTPTYLLAHMNA